MVTAIRDGQKEQWILITQNEKKCLPFRAQLRIHRDLDPLLPKYRYQYKKWIEWWKIWWSQCDRTRTAVKVADWTPSTARWVLVALQETHSQAHSTGVGARREYQIRRGKKQCGLLSLRAGSTIPVNELARRFYVKFLLQTSLGAHRWRPTATISTIGKDLKLHVKHFSLNRSRHSHWSLMSQISSTFVLLRRKAPPSCITSADGVVPTGNQFKFTSHIDTSLVPAIDMHRDARMYQYLCINSMCQYMYLHIWIYIDIHLYIMWKRTWLDPGLHDFLSDLQSVGREGILYAISQLQSLVNPAALVHHKRTCHRVKNIETDHWDRWRGEPYEVFKLKPINGERNTGSSASSSINICIYKSIFIDIISCLRLQMTNL